MRDHHRNGTGNPGFRFAHPGYWLYGVAGQGWFLGIHTFTSYVKVAFFRGMSLRPVPPTESKSKDTRYLDIHEDDQLDKAQFAAWVKQASLLPRRTNGSEANLFYYFPELRRL